MKFVITGHTSGIGKALYEEFGGIGLSRSTGFDISKDDITSHIKEADVFINNAYCDGAQVKLLYQVYDMWSDDWTKSIINIGSDIVNGADKDTIPLLRYKANKICLQEACKQLASKEDGPMVSNINPGYVDTPRVEHIIRSKISTQYIVDTVNLILHAPYHISEINIKP